MQINKFRTIFLFELNFFFSFKMLVYACQDKMLVYACQDKMLVYACLDKISWSIRLQAFSQ